MVASSILVLAVAVTSQQGVDPSRLVGTWEVVKGTQPPVGSTLEFTRSGQFKATINGVPITIEGEYKLAGDQLTLTPPGSAMSVRELTKDKLVVEGGGSSMEYKRQAAGAGGMAKAVPKAGGFSFNFGAQPKAASGKWPVVKSKNGDYTVEMPGQPNGWEDGSEGEFETHGMSHQSRGLDFIVTAIEGPTETPQADEAKRIAELRDKAIGRYGKDVKLVYEKEVRAGDLTGQEFEAKLDRMGGGPAVTRGRVFIKRKKAYVLLVMPISKSQGVPPEAGKFLESFALADSTPETSAVAKGRMPAGVSRKAAASKAGAAPRKAWGKEVDPDGDVKITSAGQSLTMQIPGTAHVLAPERDKMNAPRVVAPVPEDFVVSVRVDGAFQPSDKSTVKGLSSRQGAGLILWKDAKNYLVFQRRASVGDEGKDSNQAVLEELVGGSKGVTLRPAAAEGPLFLRLERTGGKITAAFSKDGKDWKDLKPVDTTWADGEIQVGVVAVNTSTGPHKVTFNEYSLKEK